MSNEFGSILKIASFFEINFSLTISTAILTADFAVLLPDLVCRIHNFSFSIENEKLWILQTRSGKRTAKSAVRIAVDMVKEKLISKKEAILRIDPNSLDTLLHLL